MYLKNLSKANILLTRALGKFKNMPHLTRYAQTLTALGMNYKDQYLAARQNQKSANELYQKSLDCFSEAINIADSNHRPKIATPAKLERDELLKLVSSNK